jgi:hypothetical protein
MHSDDPSVLIHVACRSQPPLFLKHSLSSAITTQQPVIMISSSFPASSRKRKKSFWTTRKDNLITRQNYASVQYSHAVHLRCICDCDNMWRTANFNWNGQYWLPGNWISWRMKLNWQTFTRESGTDKSAVAVALVRPNGVVTIGTSTTSVSVCCALVNVCQVNHNSQWVYTALQQLFNLVRQIALMSIALNENIENWCKESTIIYASHSNYQVLPTC